MRKLIIAILLLISFGSQAQIINASGNYRVRAVAAACPDADAAAYITAAGISDPTYEGLLHCFFKGLKDSVALWDSMSTGAAYWLIGGTEGKVKLNIFDPVDNDANFRLTFVNSPSFTSSGVAFNGTSQYANTHYAPSTEGIIQSSGHLSYYSTTEGQFASEINIGSTISSTSAMYLIIRRTSNLAYYIFPNGTATQVTTSNTSSLGFFSGSRTAMNRNDYYKGGVSIENNTATVSTGGVASHNIYIGCVNNVGSPALYTDKTCAFASMGKGLTAAQERALNFLVEQLMDAMGVGVQ